METATFPLHNGRRFIKTSKQDVQTMLKKEILIVIVAAVACLLSAAELPETVKFSNNCSFRIGDAEFYIQN